MYEVTEQMGKEQQVETTNRTGTYLPIFGRDMRARRTRASNASASILCWNRDVPPVRPWGRPPTWEAFRPSTHVECAPIILEGTDACLLPRDTFFPPRGETPAPSSAAVGRVAAMEGLRQRGTGARACDIREVSNGQWPMANDGTQRTPVSHGRRDGTTAPFSRRLHDIPAPVFNWTSLSFRWPVRPLRNAG